MTQLKMSDADIAFARKVARALGYGENVAYTSSSDLVGLFCKARRDGQRTGCLVKTKEFGLMFVADLRDLQLHDLAEEQSERALTTPKVRGKGSNACG